MLMVIGSYLQNQHLHMPLTLHCLPLQVSLLVPYSRIFYEMLKCANHRYLNCNNEPRMMLGEHMEK